MICPHCGYESEGLETCPLCRSPLHPGAATEDGSTTEDPAASPPPWEDERTAFPVNLVTTWQQSLFAPTRFFSGVPYGAAAARPVLYFLVLTVVGALFTLLWQAFGVEPVSVFEGAIEDIRGPSALVQFFLSPFLGLLRLIVVSLVLHLFVLMFARARRGLRATVRVVCYSAAPVVFLIVPYLGSWVAMVWVLALQIIGIGAAHRTTGARAAAIVLIPVALFILLIVLTAFLVALMTGVVLEDLQ
jgi:hypothetical protein